ncbi:MAG: hypothetical protein AAGA97_06030 [Pseudomonadota bacterium]
MRIFTNLASAAFCLSLHATGYAHADEPYDGTRACSDVRAETEAFLKEKRAASEPTDGPDNPIIKIIGEATRELNDLPRARIQTPLMSGFAGPCMAPEQFDLPPETTVDRAIEYVLTAYGLDRGLPEWGLAPLPEVDFATQSCFEIALVTAELPPDQVGNPMNDVFRAITDLFWARYDLSGPDGRERQANANNMMLFEDDAMATEPCEGLMERLAEAQGLQRVSDN